MEAKVEDNCSTQDSLVNYSHYYYTADREEQDKCMVMGGGCDEEEDDDDVDEEGDEFDEMDVIYVPEDEGDEDEGGGDAVSNSINLQEASWVDNQKTPHIRKPCGLMCRKMHK